MSDFLERIEKLSPKRLALLALDLQSRLEQIERQHQEPIAIVGIGCRIPGSEPGPDGFWDLLAQGRSAITQVPEDRWDAAAYYATDPDAPGRTSTLWGSFLPGIDCFDAPFFNISRREAVSMDPQQRLLLEVCWEALEHAGQSPGNLSGSATGVFVGVSTIDYYNLLLSRGEDAIDAYLASGTAHSVAAGRISYVLGLQGPAIAVDTSCSSSLTAVHLACQSLRTAECQRALAGGVNAILSPEVTIALSKAHMMAADGRSKTFDAAADGFVRGEGCGVVVLKRLSDALADGDRILAVIRGSAVNQDGRSSGLTAPNGAAQEMVIRQALANAHVRPEEISYVEAHGTGTSLGDPIEAHALAAVFGVGRTPGNPLTVGSVKTNIGHLEAAAGIAGLIKTVLALDREQIPQHLNFRTLNPHINWGELPVRIPQERLPWTRERKRLAGVSSFGFSGTNVHVIVEEAPLSERPESEYERPLQILAISARTEPALRTLTERYAASLAQDETELADFCFTANAGRAQLEDRAVYIAPTRELMCDALRGEPLARGKKMGNPETVFLFPGQGAQYAGMGSTLYQTQPQFRRAIDECAELLKQELEQPLLDVLWGSRTGLLDQTTYTQPALFAVEYAMAQLWIAWGIKPAAVLGHSVGEYVAACVAGVYNLSDGLKLIARRGALMQSVRGRGAMAAVMATESQVRQALEGLESEARIAALNAPESQVISGYESAIGIAEERLKRLGVPVQRLVVSHAFHSPQMAEMESAFEQVVRAVPFAPPRVELISSVTGKPVTGAEMADPGYWRRQIREPVRFREAMETLDSKSCSVYLEVGPGTTLRGLARQTIPAQAILWLGSFRKSREDWTESLESLGRLWARGADVDWSEFDRPYHRRTVSLPTYPFERHRYWIESGVRRPGKSTGNAVAPDDWFYKLEWELKPYRSVPWPTTSPAELAEKLSVRASALRTEHGFDQYDSLRGRLNAACSDAIVDALQNLGWELSAGALISKNELFVRCGIIERYHRLFRRMLDILVDDGILHESGDSYRVLRTPASSNPAASMQALIAEFPAFQPELEMTARCAPRLASVLQGRTDPLQLLFPGGSIDTAEGMYSNSPSPQVFNRLAAEVVASELKARPTGSVRILEIGAGTGGTTAYVLPHLPADRTEYVFTDVSTFFQGRAREKFRSYQDLRFQTLDIDKDPESQGFESAQFDIIIAANVLHATLDLRATVRRISSLLAPGGILVLVEGTYSEPWVDLTFGLTDGWWRFQDHQLRSYPLLSRPAWLDLLKECGFVGANAIQPLEGSQQSVFFARTPRAHLTPGRCMILSHATGIANSLANQIEEAGGIAAVVNPADPIEAQLRESDWSHLIDMRPMGAPDIANMSAAEVGEDALSRAAGPVATLQAIVKTQSRAKLWIVTRGAQTVQSSETSVAVTESTVWGIARCIRLEHPSLWGGVLDLDMDASSSQNASHCLASLLLDDGDDQAAFRNGQRYVPRLGRSECPRTKTVEIRGDRAYLVTGGLGGLGLRVAHWLVERGAREIILAGRSGLNGAQRLAVQAMEDLGATVTVAAVDVADEKALSSILPARLGGIIHAAAALAASSLIDMTPGNLAAMLRAKTQGTWALHRVTASMELDFFVLFSSNSSLLGARNLAHYVAGSQFLDAFAHYRHRQGLPALSVNWGAWPHFGNTPDAERDKFHRGGLVPMPWEGALTALGQLIASEARHTFVGDFDWSVVKPLYESQRSLPLLEHITNLTSVPGAERKPAASLSELAVVPGPDREQALVRYLVNALASILRTEPAGIDPDRPVTDFGVDSLIALEFRNRLSSDLQFSIATVSILKGPTLRQLAHLAAAVLPGAEAQVHEVPALTREFPLAFGQQAQWFAHKFMPDSSTFNVSFTAKASPHLAWKEFSRALEKLVARHPALRTIFVEDEEGRPRQRVLADAEPDLALIDAAAWQESELMDAVIGEFNSTFPLDRPPFRVRVFRRPDSDVMFFNVDHIVIDAWSVRICFADLKQLYAAELAGANAVLPEIAADYRQFVEDEANLAGGPEGDRLWNYWSQELGGGTQPLRLPSSRPRPAVLTVQGERIPLEFGPERSADVHRLARDHKVTSYAVLLAAYNVLLYHYTGQTDLVVGTSASGREDPRWANAVGYFVNLLPLRANLDGNPVFADHLIATRDTVFRALEHQNLPFAEIVARLRVRRNLERSTVFQAFFNFITDRSGDLGPLFMGVRDCAVEFGNSILTPSIIIPQQEGQSELALQVTEVAGELIGNLTYNTQILDRPVAQEMADAYSRILDTVIRDPNVRIDDLKRTGTAGSSELEDLVF